MRQRFQNGCVRKSKDGRYWVGQWREDGRLRSRVLGRVSNMTKSKAREKLAAIVKPINERAAYVVGPPCGAQIRNHNIRCQDAVCPRTSDFKIH